MVLTFGGASANAGCVMDAAPKKSATSAGITAFIIIIRLPFPVEKTVPETNKYAAKQGG